MYPNKKTEQTCKLVALGGILLLILAGAAMIGAFGAKGSAAYPKFRALGYASLAAAGVTYIVVGRYGIREQLRKYLMVACGCTAGFFLTQIISGIVLFMKSGNTMDALSIGMNIFFAILGAFYCVYFIFDLRKNYFNMRYDQMVFAVLAGLGVVAAALLFLYSAKAPYELKILERATGAGARLITFILPAAMLWFCDRLTEPFTDNEVAQVRVAERQAIRIAEAQKMTEQYNKVEAKKAAERRRREEELVAKEEEAKRKLEEEKQERIAAEKRAAELEVLKAKEKAEEEARRAEEEAKRAAEEEIRRQEEIQRQLEEAQKAAEEAQRRAEEEARRAAEAAEEARRKAEEEVRKAQEAQEEARRREKEAQRRIEAEQRRLEEEALAAMTPEERRIYEEEKALMEQEEALRKADEEARAEALREVEAYRRAEEELRKSAEEETKKKIETLQMALSAGLITKEEFEARKAKILGQ